MVENDDFKKFLSIKTPVVVYNLDDLSRKLYELNQLIPEWVNVIYSVKANSNKKIIDFFKESNLIKGFEVASVQELQKVEKFYEEEIFVTGPGFSDDQIKKCMKKGHVYDFNNIEQIYRMKNVLKNRNIGIRMNLEKSELEHNKNDLTSRFGIDIKNLKHGKFSEFLINYNIKVTHIHIHNGEKDLNELKKITRLISEIIENNCLSNDLNINIGGGWEHILKNNLFNKAIIELQRIKKISNSNLYIEPGKALIDSIGYLVASVINKYHSKNCLNLILNVSAHNLITWFPTYPIVSNKNSDSKIVTNIWGNTCYEEDFFVKKLTIDELDIDDKIIFHPFGAYFKSNSKKLHDIDFPKEVYYQNGTFVQ
ncbi:hypothetical protein [Staphylococcus equorum]|uniref:hypothetical protein n=1 Tax=Staphylococcus equorum TaxID=246432 RepID=UPI003FB910A9